jgi:tryptophan synthase alpha subunit
MRTRPASSASPDATRVDVPLVPMTYSSLLEAYGWERFAADARAAGARA